jgi:AcrR family transcriptional regulator
VSERAEAASGQRRAILAATAQQVAARGYGAVTVELIAFAAKVGKETFYRHFEDREAAYLALFDELAEEASRSVRGAYEESPGPWPERLTAALRALFDLATEKPDAVRACLAEALAAGPAAIERYERVRECLGDLLRDGRPLNPRGAELPASLEVTLAGGVLWMIDRKLESTGPQSLDALFPETLSFLFTPYLGQEPSAPPG